jgi:hypothetical protein
MVIYPVLLEGDLSYDLRVRQVCSDYIDLSLWVLSDKFEYTDALFEYQVNDQWLSDAHLSFSNVRGNALIGVLANQEHILRWHFSQNKLSRGNACRVRIRFLPQVFAAFGSNSAAETVSLANRVVVSPSGYPSGLLNFGYDQRRLCAESDYFVVRDKNGQQLFAYGGTSGYLATWAQEKRDGKYLVLVDNKIYEYDIFNASPMIRYVDLGTDVVNPKYFLFDDLTSNILVSGNESGKVLEIEWGARYYGTIVNTANGFTKPIAATYYPDRTRILIVDQASPPLVVTYSWADGVEASVSSITIDGVVVPLVSPFIPFVMSDNTVIIVEQNGETLAYSTQADQHSSLLRAGLVVGTGKDTLSAYQGLTFTPLLHNSS